MVLPLQFGIPGGVELMILLIIGLILIALPVYFVYNDAKKRNNDNATLWAVATLLGGLVGNIFGALLIVVLYLIVGRD
jgi:amino acid permease